MQKLSSKQTVYINLPKKDYVEQRTEEVIIEEEDTGSVDALQREINTVTLSIKRKEELEIEIPKREASLFKAEELKTELQTEYAVMNTRYEEAYKQYENTRKTKKTGE